MSPERAVDKTTSVSVKPPFLHWANLFFLPNITRQLSVPSYRVLRVRVIV